MQVGMPSFRQMYCWHRHRSRSFCSLDLQHGGICERPRWLKRKRYRKKLIGCIANCIGWCICKNIYKFQFVILIPTTKKSRTVWLVQPTVLDFLFFNCGFFLLQRFQPVSYTHLDVYKRQVNGLFIFCQHVGYMANPSKTISKFSSLSTIQKFIDKARRGL